MNLLKYCDTCNEETKIIVKKEKNEYIIAGSEIEVEYKIPRCTICNSEVHDDNLFNINSEKAKETYIKKYNILSSGDIKNILDKYHIKENTLSEVLGWKEITITKYLKGKLPSKAHSDKLRIFDNNCKLVLKVTKKSKLTDGEIKAMGEIADMMIEGIMCERCGLIIDGEEVGYPRLCEACEYTCNNKEGE